MVDPLNPRTFEAFETTDDGIQVVHASWWEVALTTETISLLNDQVDPGLFGIVDEKTFKPYTGRKEIYAFGRKEGFAARAVGSFVWTKVYKTKMGAIKAARKVREKQKKKDAKRKLPPGFFKGTQT